jgi:Zn finger protein HypA/HybF involved in hydrogenase expression
MHESGLIQALLRTASAEAERQDAELTGIDLRLGVLAGGSPEHLREHFEIELARLGLGPIALNIAADPEYPGGIEIVGVELRQR